MNTPDRTTAAAFNRYITGEIVADSAALKWTGLYARRCRFPRVVDRLLVPATAEPLIACQLAGSAQFSERDHGQSWLVHQLGRGDLFVTRSKTPYEVKWSSPAGQELETIQVHIAVDDFLSAVEVVHPGQGIRADVVDYFGRDETLAYLCFACAEMLSARVPGTSGRVAALTRHIASHLAEVYTDAASGKPDFRGGLQISQLRKVEDFVRDQLAEEISVDALAGLVELSPFHFSRVFKQTTGMSPLQYVTRERVARAQQLIRETSHSLIEIALDVGYTSPSHFAQVFRKAVGVTPTEFRGAL